MIVPAPSPSPDLRAEDIFARTRAAFAARTYPPTMKYGIRISGFRNGGWSGRTYDAFERWPERTVFARSISEEEAANPYKPPMYAKSFLDNFGVPGPQSGGAQGPHILGFPELAVTYAFGLTPRTTFAAEPEATGGLRTIAGVRAVSRTYDVRLAGEDSVDGNACWHLTLRPLGNPGTYRVRELWVDEQSYQTRKLVTDGNFTRKETGSGLWTVTYVQSGDTWYLESEVSQAPIDDDSGRYDHIAVQFIGVTAAPHELLDFGLAGTAENDLVVEPDDPLPRH